MADIVEDTKKALGTTFKKNNTNIAIWGGFLTASLLVYYFLSSGDFSFLLTYASFMRCFGLAILIYRMLTTKSAKGVSVKSLEIYALVFITRLASIMRHQGYLPFDKTGDWFYHFVEFLSLAAVFGAIFGIFMPFISTYEERYDRFGNLHVPNELGVVWLVVPCLLLAAVCHPDLNREWLADVCWTSSMYLEACAILPQIYMFQKQASDQGGIVEALIGHTVFALGFARVFELWFWIGSFKELSTNAGNNLPGYVVLLSQVAHLGLMGDFFYYYAMSLTRGLPMELPTSSEAISNFV